MPSHMNLNTRETALITAAIETQAQEVLERFAQIRARFGSPEEFRAEMRKVSGQIGSGPEHRYGGVYPRDKFRLAGGIEGSLLPNIFYHFGLKYNSDLSVDIARKAVHALVMRRAMAADPDLLMFIRSMIVGAYEHSAIRGVRLRLDTEMVQMLNI